MAGINPTGDRATCCEHISPGDPRKALALSRTFLQTAGGIQVPKRASSSQTLRGPQVKELLKTEDRFLS